MFRQRWLIVYGIYCFLFLFFGTSFAADSLPTDNACTMQFSQWMLNYHQTLNSRQVPAKINSAIQCGLLDECRKTSDTVTTDYNCPVSYFFAKIFAKNPMRIFNWMSAINFTSVAQRRVIYEGLWFSNTAESTQYLNGRLRAANNEEAVLIKQIMQQPHPDVLAEKINNDVIEKLFMSFLATGDVQYLRRIVSVLSWKNPLDSPQTLTPQQQEIANTIYTVKRFLRAYLQQNKVVFNICRNMLPSLDSQAQLALKQLLYDSDAVYQDRMQWERKMIEERMPAV